MNTIIKKSQMLCKGLLIATLAIGSLAACSDDDDAILTALSTPAASGDATATVSTLTFSWDEVANATQYAYELKNATGDVVSGDVTNKTSVYFTGLRDGATYTLDVWAYAKAYSDQYTRSKVGTFTGTTIATKTLAAPQNYVETVNGVKITISWDAVEHADSYMYQVDEQKWNGTVENSVTLNGLSVGSHKISVYALSSDEEYPRAETSSFEFTVEQQRQVIWQRTGDFTTYSGNTAKRTLIYYDDDTYTLKSWYGVEGYDLSFTVDATSGELKVVSSYESGGWYWIPTGVDANGTWVYTGNQSSNYSSTTGYVHFYIYDNSGYDIFNFKLTADDFVGSYDDNSYQWYNNEWSSWGTTTVTATKVDDKTLKFAGVAWNSSDAWEAELELDENGYATGKLVFKGGQVYNTWYTLGDYNSGSANVTATFDSSLNITLSDYAFWYGGYAYYYMYTTLTKQ
jgi:hypothetical protein